MRTLLPLVLLAGCSDYQFHVGDKGNPGADASTPGDTATCTLDLATGGTATVDETCIEPDTTVSDPWNVAIELQWTGVSTNPSVSNVIMAPVVGNLTDDNGDGVVDGSDDPDIVFVAFAGTTIQSGTLVAIDGATGAEHFAVPGFNAGGGIALADVDMDGVTDVLAFDTSNRPVAVDASGSLLWTASRAVSGIYPQATAADVDENGRPEVIADDLVLDGPTGTVLQALSIDAAIPYRMPAVGDIDLDGIQEVIEGNKVYDPTTGAVEWSSSITGSYGDWSAIIDADGDPEAEVVMVGGGRMGVYEADGTPIHQFTAETSRPGAPCAADFDGDGQVEIGVPSNSRLTVYDLDGAMVWQRRIDDSSGLASCSGYDIDGDGKYELLYADQYTFFIFNGGDGTVEYSQSGHCSGTLWEYPTVADVNQDGSADIVVANNNYLCGASGWSGITVFGSAAAGWLKSGPTWNTHDFAVTNINSDGSVPSSPTPWWQVYNVYRARPSTDVAATDLLVAITDVCVTACNAHADVMVAVQVTNTGGVDTDPNIPVSLYANNGGTLSLIATKTIPAAVPAGTTLDALEFDLHESDLGTDGLVVRVDDDGSGTGINTECDESNNEATWSDSPC